MPITMNCPACGKPYTLADNQAGKRVRCPNCAETFRVREFANDGPPLRGAIAKGTRMAAAAHIVAAPRLKGPSSLDKDADDKPVKSRGSSLMTPLIVGGVVLFLLLVGGGIAVYFLAAKKGVDGTVESSASNDVCHEFARLKNAGDSKANDLLAPVPDLTQTVIDEQDKPAFDAAVVLREPGTIIDVLPEDPTAPFPRFALLLKGGFDIPKVSIRDKFGVHEGSQRGLFNPEVLVEVRDGRIYPLKVGLPRIRPQY
jgi:predicted Zn finger-like uncharacterized protein